VWAVTCAEVAAADLAAMAAPLTDFPSHALIDFTAHPEKHFRKLAKKLKESALARGSVYHPA
jgi:hypothetical protein